ncbi:MAG TPA: polyketide synthase, partial [Thermoanaerobaculia bacterium]|nr:polyketide synthase [Thermoanaerobaculia bacterium]
MATAVLHPLLQSNTSDFSRECYSSTFYGDELFVKDRVLTPAAYLEMARAAVAKAALSGQESSLELCDVVWAQPFGVESGAITIALFRDGDERIDWEIYSEDGDEEIVHCQGCAIPSHQPEHGTLDLDQIGQRLGKGQSLTRLRLPTTEEDTAGKYVLHPTLFDGALQVALGLVGEHEGRLPAALESLRIVSPCTSEMVAWVRNEPGSQAVDIDLCDERGKVSAQLRGLRWQQTPLESAKPVAAPPPVRREIVFTPQGYAIPVSVAPKKAAAISLTALGAGILSAPGASAGLTRIALSNTGLGTPEQSSASPAVSPIRLFDCGDGIFSIEIAVSQTENIINHLRQALDRVQQEEVLCVLMLNGLERCFLGGGREEYNEAVLLKLYQAIVSFPYPVIAAVQGDATGAGFMAAALCDFIVCNEDANYSYTDAESRFYPTAPETILLSERFGHLQAEDFLYLSPASVGRKLRAKGWTCPILPGRQVEPRALELASTLATKPQSALRLLKRHLNRRLTGLVDALTPVEAEARAMEELSETVAVITYGRAGVKDLVADLSRYRVIVLVSEDSDVPDDVAVGLQRLIIESKIPIVAALPGNAKGNIWLISQFCDACVYSRTGSYTADISPDLARAAVAIFTYRFGNDAGKEVLLSGADYLGVDLQQRVGTLIVAEHEDVLPMALRVAESWAGLPRPTLAAWKKQTATVLGEKILGLPVGLEQQDDTPDGLPAAPASIPLRSTVVTVTAHPEGIVVVKMEDRAARNTFSDAIIEGVSEAFAHIEQTPAYKVVVLTGYDSYFAAGGTREGLVAIQQGKAKFTDVKIFQLPLDCKLPVIAAMQGHGIGAGWTMGMFADLVLMSEESRYVSPYMSYGFTPGAGATWILADKMGPDLARESLFSGRYYTGSELKERGLRLRILPRSEVFPAAMALAGRMVRVSRSRLISLKHQLTQYALEAVEETYRLELDMHERTFVGQPDTLSRIRSNFDNAIEPPLVKAPTVLEVPRARRT